MRALRWFGFVLIVIGVVCLGVAGWRMAEASSFQSEAERALARHLAAAAAPDLRAPGASGRTTTRRQLPALESETRAASAAGQRSAASSDSRAATTKRRDASAVSKLDERLVGRLEIPRLGVSVLVVTGEDEATLARAVGHLDDTPLPWESGNTALAGHRDTFFRPLRDIQNGDAIRLTTPRGTFDYRVVSIDVVEPDDVSVLAPTSTRALTLITCYPFSYVGPAPQRFIVHAR